MICHHGGLTFIHHNEVRNLTVSWLHEECHDVIVELPLQWLTSKAPVPASANRRDNARVDIHARGFWGRWQGVFFDIRVFHPNTLTYRQTQVGILFCKHELEKKWEYGDCVWSVESAPFPPLVFSTFDGLGRKANSHLANLLAVCHNIQQSNVVLDALHHLFLPTSICHHSHPRE